MHEILAHLSSSAHLSSDSSSDAGVTNEPTLEEVRRTLAADFTRSQRCHLVLFHCGAVVKAHSTLDGSGGSALLTELERRFGTAICDRREQCKIFLAQSAASLGWPLRVLPSGALGIGLRPKCVHEPTWVSLIAKVVRALPVPPEVMGSVLVPMLGDVWWGRERRTRLPGTSREVRAYSLLLSRAHARLCEQLFPFCCTALCFSNAAQVVGEWTASHVLSLRTADIWTFVLLLRLQRQRQRRAVDILNIGGLGDVFI